MRIIGLLTILICLFCIASLLTDGLYSHANASESDMGNISYYMGNFSAIPWAPYVSEAFYTLNVINRTPVIDPGDILEIELYLKGFGVPEKNKLSVMWSSPYVIEKENPGDWIYTPKGFDLSTMTTIEGVNEQDLRTFGNASHGIEIKLHAGFFTHSREAGEVRPWELYTLRSEVAVDGNPPILFKLNTSKNARPGDYSIQVTFTYGYWNDQCTELRQDYKTVNFHVTSWWERYQKWIVGSGAGIAFMSLLVVTTANVYQIYSKRKTGAEYNHKTEETPSTESKE